MALPLRLISNVRSVAPYEELRQVARRQLRALRPGETLATTALVNEAYLKLVRRPVEYQDKTHFFALAARALRQILVDDARERHSKKRGGDRRQTTLDDAALSVEAIADEMIALDPALSRLEGVDEWLARLVEWPFFGGMTEDEIAIAEQITSRTVRRDCGCEGLRECGVIAGPRGGQPRRPSGGHARATINARPGSRKIAARRLIDNHGAQSPS